MDRTTCKATKRILFAILLAAMICISLCAVPAYAVETNIPTEAIVDDGIAANAGDIQTRGLFTSISLSIKGGGNGTVIATARNDFTLGNSIIIVCVELYSSTTYQNTSSNMEFVKSETIDDLNIYQSLSVVASTNGQQKYWRARLRYKFDDANWDYKETETILYNQNGVKV